MTITAPITTIHGSDRSASFRTQPHGFDRVIERVGVALVKWSRSRTARAIVTPEEYIRLVEADELKQERERSALRITQRMGL